jgi:hypothetical protein
MNAYARYKKETDRINAITLELGLGYLTDMGVDAENMVNEDGTMWKNDDSEEFWEGMFYQLHNSVGMRMDELGLKPSLYNINY